MVRYLRSGLIALMSFAVVALVIVVVGVGSAVPVTANGQEAPRRPTPTPTPGDFYLWLAYDTRNWFDPSYVVRSDVSAFPGPHYALASYSGWFWSDNSLTLRSRSGNFQGNVTLNVLNLPPNIVAELPSSIFVPLTGSVSIPLKLRASTSAALANVSGVTFRATSGSIVHTVQLPTFTVVDQLPPLPPS